MKIVEEKKSNPNTILSNLTNFVDKGGDDKVIEMQADELVSLIRASAEDPKIVSIFGIFGNGGGISAGGWAHLEEIRNALEVFATASQKRQDLGTDKETTTKSMYAYSNTFSSQQSMKEYYLASVFPTIHLQSQADLNLYGVHATNVFFRDFTTLHIYYMYKIRGTNRQ